MTDNPGTPHRGCPKTRETCRIWQRPLPRPTPRQQEGDERKAPPRDTESSPLPGVRSAPLPAPEGPLHELDDPGFPP